MTTRTSPHLVDALDDLLEIRPFPSTSVRLIDACQDANVTASRLSGILTTDPALAVKLLQLANSPVYGHSGQICSVQHATVVIGMRALKNLALSAAVNDVFETGSAQTDAARKELWRHSLACGSFAQTIANGTGICCPEEAFLAGIVHDVGKLFFTDYRPEEYSLMLANTDSGGIVRQEEATFGIDHTAVGGRCSLLWGLPDEIGDTIRFHHAPDQSDFASDLTDLVHAANQLTRLWQNGDPDQPCPATDAILLQLKIDLSPQETTELRRKANKDLATVMKVHST